MYMSIHEQTFEGGCCLMFYLVLFVFSLAVLATVPSAMSLFFTYEMVRLYWYRPYLRQDATDALLQGTLASVISLCLTQPFDTIRRKMQVKSVKYMW